MEEKQIQEEQVNTIDPSKEYSVVTVTFNENGKGYFFEVNNLNLNKGDFVIVDTSRGTEYGCVKEDKKTILGSKLKSPLRPVIRLATQEDKQKKEKNLKIEKEAFKVFPEKAAKYNLPIKIVSVECSFDNTHLFFYFSSETHVDFRDLVKDLASIFHTRIQLIQIGIRDEAKMLGGIGPCGRPFCCSTFLNDPGQVTIKMAKEQNLAISSSKNSGCCGRLMCCLRYEYPLYEEALKFLPHFNSYVKTPDGNGYVSETRPLSGEVKVRLDGENKIIKTYSAKDLTILSKGQGSDDDSKKDD